MLKNIKGDMTRKFRRYKFRTRLEAILAGKTNTPIIDVCDKDRQIGKTTELALNVLTDNPSYVVVGTVQQKKYIQESLSNYFDEYVPVATPEELLHGSPISYNTPTRALRSKVKLYVDDGVSETQVIALVNAGYNVKVYLRHFYY